MATDDPNYSYLLRRIEELEQLVSANPLRSASVSRGTTEFRENSTLLITDSNMRVVGVAYVSGRLEGEGTFSWSGPTLLDGSVEITNTLDVLASTRLRGETTIEGLTRLLAELIVEGKITVGNITIEDGKIKAGNVEVEPDKITVAGGASPATLQDGALRFGTGGTVAADTSNNGVRMAVGPNQVYVGTGAASIQVGSQSVLVTSSGVFFSNLPTTPKSLTPDESPIGSMYIEPSGQAFRVVAG